MFIADQVRIYILGSGDMFIADSDLEYRKWGERMTVLQAFGKSMRRAILLLIGMGLLGPSLPSSSLAASPYSMAFVAGGGWPVGWWGGRWGAMQSGELNFRYEIERGFGFFLLTGLNKTYYTERGKEEIAAGSRYSDRQFADSLYTITKAEEGGSFKQLPVGTGFYGEALVGGLRAYGSAAFVVNLWKFERGQVFQQIVTPPSSDTIPHDDSWNDEQDGSNVGLQFTAGVLYPLRKGLHLEGSIAYHFTGISKDNSAIAFWGKPARTWSAEQKADAKNHADFIALRVGVRLGG